MASASVYNSLSDASLEKVAGLSLSLGGEVVPVEKRKLPTHSEAIDEPLPRIFLVPSPKPLRDEPFDSGVDETGPRRLREYLLRVVVIAAGNGDPETNLPTYMEWRQEIARAFGAAKSVAVDELLYTQVIRDATINADAYAKGYDYGALELRFECVEPAGPAA